MKNLYLLFIIILSLSIATIAGELDNYLVILHTNDIHGRAVATNETWGYAGIKKAKDNLISKGAEVLLLDAGDFSQGTPIVNLSHGANGVEFMNMAQYDAATLGNHEFDWGVANALRNVQNASFKVLCANLYRDNKHLFASNYVFTLKNNIKIGVFGIDTPECATKINPKLLDGMVALQSKELYEETQKQIDTLKDCELVICLGHLGDDISSSPNRSIDVIKNTKGIDLFIDGHSHTKIPVGIMENETLRVSTGSYCESIGYVVYKINDNHYNFVKAGLFEKSDLIIPAIIDKKPSLDKEINSKINKIDHDTSKELSKPIFNSMVELNGSFSPGNRTEETNLGDLIADAFLSFAKSINKDCVASIENGGSIRDYIHKGQVSTKDLLQTLPFENTLCILKVKGSDLLEALEVSTCSTPIEIGGFPQISGMEIEINTSIPFEPGKQYENSTYFAPKNPGTRVTIKSIGGEKFDPNKEYFIATSDFVAAGGDTYTALTKASNYLNIGKLDTESVYEYVSNTLQGTIPESYEKPQGRIVIK